MRSDSDHDSLHADEQMRAATQRLRDLGWLPPPIVLPEAGESPEEPTTDQSTEEESADEELTDEEPPDE